jgi:hypothetical protein
VSSEDQRKDGLTFWQKLALALVVAFVALTNLVYLASQTLMWE